MTTNRGISMRETYTVKRHILFAHAQEFNLHRQTSVLFFCFLLFTGFSAIASAQASPTPPHPLAAAPSVLANGTLYVSGQGSRKPDGSHPSEFPAQVDQALHNVRAILNRAGMDFDNVVWLNVYLTSISDIASMDNIYWKEIGSSPPARTVLTVAALPNGERIVINCIAVQDKAHRRAIWPDGWPKGSRTDPPAIEAGDVLYLSAQGGADPRTGKLASDFAGEVKQALDNVSTVLQTVHMSTKNVVWVNPYMSVGGQYDAMGKIYATYFEFRSEAGTRQCEHCTADSPHEHEECGMGKPIHERRWPVRCDGQNLCHLF